MPETMLYPTRFQPYEGPCREESGVLVVPRYLRRHPAIIQSILTRCIHSGLRLPKSRTYFPTYKIWDPHPKAVFQEHTMPDTLKPRRTQPRSAAAGTTTVARTRAMRTGKQKHTFICVYIYIYIYICIHLQYATTHIYTHIRRHTSPSLSLYIYIYIY